MPPPDVPHGFGESLLRYIEFVGPTSCGSSRLMRLRSCGPLFVRSSAMCSLLVESSTRSHPAWFRLDPAVRSLGTPFRRSQCPRTQQRGRPRWRLAPARSSYMVGYLGCFAREEPPMEEQQFFFFSSRRRHTRLQGDWSSDVCSSD